MGVNMVQILFFVLFLITGTLGFLFFLLDLLIPKAMVISSRYEKYTYLISEHLCISRIEVPEVYFKHFFKFPVHISSLLLGLAISKYFFHIELPEILYRILDKLLGTDREALVTPEATLLALFLLTVQCAQRFYEMHYVQIFSDKESRELSNYIFAYVHYIALIASVVGESEGFVRGSSGDLEWKRLTFLQWSCAIVFIFVSLQQLRTNEVLVNLIKEEKPGEEPCDLDDNSIIPRGGLFDYTYGAIELTELIMYSMLLVILRESTTYYYVYYWIAANEVSMAIFSKSYYNRRINSHLTRDRAYLF